jgi:hypothetical protein
MRRLRPFGVGALTFLVLAFNTAFTRREFDLKAFPFARRYWEDQAVAIRMYVDARDPGRRVEGLPPDRLKNSADLCRSLIRRLVKREGIRPWEFWRTIWTSPFELSREDLAPPRSAEDQGRAQLLAVAFLLRGGISPFLLLWLAVLLALPVFLWLSWEFFEGGHGLAGAFFLLSLSLSPFVVECLSLPHAGLGFYLLAWLILLAFSASFILRTSRLAGFLVRAAAAGVAFAAATHCRSGVALLFGGYLVALVIASWRIAPRGVVLVAGLLLLSLPSLVLRPRAHHNVWPSIWEGLGDFDREKGYFWSDDLAKAALIHSGIDPGSEERIGITCDACEDFFKGVILRDIRKSPSWYLKILEKRLVATVLQEKLWPYGPRDGISMSPAETENEGDTDKYYRMTTTVDFFGFGGWRHEVRVGALIAPTLALAILGLFGRSSGIHAGLLILVPCAIAALASPLLITTASGVETEMFALCYLLGAAFLLEWVVRGLSRRRGASGLSTQGDTSHPGL